VFVYLDESGDTGFRFPNSSNYFVITLFLVDDPIPIHNAIDELRAQLGIARHNEFKFYNSSDKVRHAFLEMMRHQRFTIRVLVINKTKMTAPQMKKRDTFYNFLVKMVLEYDNGAIQDAMLILDESVKSKKSKQQFTSYLRRSLNTDQNLPKVREIRYHRSHSDNLIQAADMMSGAVFARFERGNPKYFNLIRSKFSDIWVWRPRTQ
jgi:hypothetical protein